MDAIKNMSLNFSYLKSPLFQVLACAITIAAMILAFIYTKYKQRLREIEMEIHSFQSGESIPEDKPAVSPEEIRQIGDGEEEKAAVVEPAPEVDPLEYCEHIQSKIKQTKQRLATKKIEESMTEDQKQNEHELQRQQLEAIFKLMEEQKDKFGVDTVGDVQNQMKLYA